MGRRPTFDRAHVVRAARDLFWTKGYDGTALPELEAATGLARSSIYHAFGSKRGLFDAAVEDYLTAVVTPRLALLTGPDGPRAYFESLAHDLAATDPDRRGCLLVDAAAGPAAHDDALAAVVTSYRCRLFDAFRDALAARGDHDADTTARVLTTMNIGALAIARVDRTEAIAIAHAARELAAPEVTALDVTATGAPGR
ncbi:TetR/AcrR family transcriptional regulator [Rhodococcoides corynebacterioides]|uniref:TetR/AcrR family transcriptional regulator n=1 Tax=Rhodococcoides corynebacterioides TaxID=53972 RepID=UPI00082C74D1|nr:TetR/AcrR family transcriptional regulator [Rhodococcus corynebacterioides]MBY6352304.1 TetR/AcrR family transcriptional regulator [Rhodococcus corynebacterioides]